VKKSKTGSCVRRLGFQLSSAVSPVPKCERPGAPSVESVEKPSMSGHLACHLAFGGWETLARVLTGKRMELRTYLRPDDVTSVRALAKALKRESSNANADMKALGEGRSS